MKWYKVQNYTYVSPIGPKDAENYYLCLVYEDWNSDITLGLGWWLCFPDDLVDSVDFKVSNHEWLQIIFTYDIEME